MNAGAGYGINVMMVIASGTVHNSVWIGIAAWLRKRTRFLDSAPS